MLQSTNSPGIPQPPAPAPQESNLLPSDQPVPSPLPSTSALGLSNTPKLPISSIDVSTLEDHERQGLGPAMDYVQRIKTRFINDPDTYKQFLEILASHRSIANNVGFYLYTLPQLTRHWQAEVFAKVEELFKDAPDLSSAFRDFLPGAQDADSLGVLRGTSARTGTPGGEHARAQKRKQPTEPAPAPAKRRRRAADRDKEKDRDGGRTTGSRVSVHDLIHTPSVLGT